MKYVPHEYQRFATDFIVTHPTAAIFLDMGIRKHYDLTPAGIISSLGLRDVNYNNTATLGHFWHQWMPWEE